MISLRLQQLVHIDFAFLGLFSPQLLHGLDLSSELFSPIFAMSRVVGWIGHCFEQQELARLIRPRAAYTGERDRQWVPLPERG